MSRKTLKIFLALSILFLGIFLFYQGLNSKQTRNLFRTPAKPLNTPNSPALVPQNSPLPNGFTMAQVVKVVDGDTIEVSIGGQNYKLRYIGIDTPETVDPRRPVGCFGKEASDENEQVLFPRYALKDKKLVAEPQVYLEKDITDTDKYGRLLRYVYLPLPDGSLLFVNDYLVRQGFAQSYSYPPDVKHQDRFLQAQDEARVNNRGLWEKCK